MGELLRFSTRSTAPLVASVPLWRSLELLLKRVERATRVELYAALFELMETQTARKATFNQRRSMWELPLAGGITLYYLTDFGPGGRQVIIKEFDVSPERPGTWDYLLKVDPKTGGVADDDAAPHITVKD